jgi:GxxExxY protein
MSELVLPEESYRIIGACFEVYKEMGCGFLEAVYQECLELEFRRQGIPYIAHPWIELAYKGEKLKQQYNADFVCFGKIIVEIKASSELTDRCRAQSFNYLHALKMPLALLVNFGHYPKLEYDRIALTRNHPTN